MGLPLPQSEEKNCSAICGSEILVSALVAHNSWNIEQKIAYLLHISTLTCSSRFSSGTSIRASTNSIMSTIESKFICIATNKLTKGGST